MKYLVLISIDTDYDAEQIIDIIMMNSKNRGDIKDFNVEKLEKAE